MPSASDSWAQAVSLHEYLWIIFLLLCSLRFANVFLWTNDMHEYATQVNINNFCEIILTIGHYIWVWSKRMRLVSYLNNNSNKWDCFFFLLYLRISGEEDRLIVFMSNEFETKKIDFGENKLSYWDNNRNCDIQFMFKSSRLSNIHTHTHTLTNKRLMFIELASRAHLINHQFLCMDPIPLSRFSHRHHFVWSELLFSSVNTLDSSICTK